MLKGFASILGQLNAFSEDTVYTGKNVLWPAEIMLPSSLALLPQAKLIK